MRKNPLFLRYLPAAGRTATRAMMLLLAVPSACKKAPPPPARFCDQDLSGVWVNASDRHFAYRFRDHGEILRGEYLVRQDDGRLETPADPVLFELHRTAAALAGSMKSTGKSPGGRSCPIEFGVRLQSCEPSALQAVVETAIPVTDECRRQANADGGEVAPVLAEFRFERDHPPDAGPSEH